MLHYLYLWINAVTQDTPDKALDAPATISAEEMLSFDIEEPIRGADVADAYLLGQLFRKAYDEQGDLLSVEARTFVLLEAICSFHFKPEDRAAPFGPMMQWEDKRTAIPEDFAGDQSKAFAIVAERVKHSGLRARLADTAWLNDKRNGRVAAVAVEAYAQCVRSLLSGDFRARFQREESTPFEAFNLARRSVQIAVAIKKRNEPLSGVAADALLELRSVARSNKDVSLFRRVSAVGWNHGILDSAELAADLEALLLDEPDPMGRKAIWEQAAACYRDIDQDDDAKRCSIAAAEEMVAMATAMRGSPIASASWLADAIKVLRQIKGTKSRRAELEVLLREVQEDISDEMSTFSSGPIDLTDIASGTVEVFEPMSLPTALGQLAVLTRSESIAARRAAALETLKQAPLSSVFGMTKVDSEGKTIAVVPGADLSGDPGEDWMLHRFAESDGLRRKIFISGQFEPVRRHLSSRFSFTERSFYPIVQRSPFVPVGHEDIFALGFARMMQGDTISAAHLLLPQLENSIRDVIKKSGKDASIIQADMSQEDRSLSSMLENNRDRLDEIFGADLILEIDLLFNSRLGPALRHDIAHGKISTAECSAADVRYACWLIYQITCLPLLPHWEGIVSEIERSQF